MAEMPHVVGWALCGHETPAGQAQDTDTHSGSAPHDMAAQKGLHRPALQSSDPATSRSAEHEQDSHSKGHCSAENGVQPFHVFVHLSRSQRIELGQQCKQLIDKGREHWLMQQGFKASFVLPCLAGSHTVLTWYA